MLLQRRVVCEPENDAGNRRQIEDRAVGSVVETAALPLGGFNTGFGERQVSGSSHGLPMAAEPGSQ
jgi:hypothetical protein